MRVESPQPHPASLWCRTLGDLALYPGPDDSRPLMEAGKPLAILAYVALAPGGRTARDHVAELMWPGADLTEARHSLRQSLYRLRHAAGAPLIELRGTDLTLTSAVRLDCLEAERLAADGDLARAHRLLRGNFLEGFAIPQSHEFESWAESERIRFRDEWARAAERLAEERLRGGDGPRALEIAEELAGVRPLSDGPARLVMRALAETGRHATALARFHAYAELLAREVEAEPGAELRAYASEVERYVRERPEPSASLLPFVGRAEQWSVLEGAWEAAREGKGSAHLIEGGAGLGKTRLAAELVSRVRSAGGLVLAGKCFQIEHAVPYAVIAEALGALVDREEIAGLGRAWLAEAARLLPEVRERFPDLPAVGAAGSDAAGWGLHGDGIVRSRDNGRTTCHGDVHSAVHVDGVRGWQRQRHRDRLGD